jgi:replicative DNA helicase
VKRTTPHDPIAEEHVIGGVLLHAGFFQRAAGFVNADDFYHPAHRAIWSAVVECDKRGQPIDAVTVGQMLASLGIADHLRAFGGLDYLVEVQGRVVTVENIEFHARIVSKKATRRRLAAALSEQVARAFDERIEDDEFQAGVDDLLLKAQAEGRLEKAQSIREVLKQTLRDVGESHERRAKGERDTSVVYVHVPKFDALTGGLQPGQQVVVAGRPSMGKSALAKDFALAAAVDGVPVYIANAEMTNKQTAIRMLAGKGQVNSMAIRHARLDDQAWVRLYDAASQLSELPIYLDDEAHSLGDLKANVRRWRATVAKSAPVGLIVVDYMQLLKVTQKRDRQASREQEVAEISRTLKLLAKQTRCVVISLSQLSRKLEERADKRPMMSDLRESGAIEQDADIICFVYRDEVYDTDENNPHKGTAELIVDKQRDGDTATVWLRWDGAHTTFSPFPGEPPPKETGRRRGGSSAQPPPPRQYVDDDGFA